MAAPLQASVNTDNFKAIIYIIGTFLSFAILDGAAKYASQSIDILFLVWSRFVVQAIMICVITHPSEWKKVIVFRRPWLQLFRAAILLGATVFNFFALRELQLAQTVSVLFCSPFMIAILGIILLKESVGIKRWSAILIGFCGVLVVFRPGFSDLPIEVIYSILTMICYSIYTVITRILAPVEDQASLVIFPAIFISIVMFPSAFNIITMPSYPTIIAIIIAGIMGTLGHWLHTCAHQMANAATLAPYMYTEIVWMIAIGYLIFGDTPDIYMILGAMIITTSGLYHLHRERQLRRFQ